MRTTIWICLAAFISFIADGKDIPEMMKWALSISLVMCAAQDWKEIFK